MEYQFLLKKPGGRWHIVRKYGPSNGYTYVPPTNSHGTYDIEGLALTRYQVKHKDWKQAVGSLPWAVAAPPENVEIGLDPLQALPADGKTIETLLADTSIKDKYGTSAWSPLLTLTLKSSNPNVASVPYHWSETDSSNVKIPVTAGKTPGHATITVMCGSTKATVAVKVVPVVVHASFDSTSLPCSTGPDSYSWHVDLENQFYDPITGLNTATVVDTTAQPNTTYNGVNKNLTVAPVRTLPGEYTITVHSTAPVPGTHTAQITIDGKTLISTFKVPTV